MEDGDDFRRSKDNSSKHDRSIPDTDFGHDGKDKITTDDHTCREAFSAFIYKLKQNRTFKGNVFYTICIYSAYFTMGWQFAQIGPVFEELQIICGVGLERGSWIFTASSVAYVVGSLNGGWLYKKIDRNLFFGLLHAFLGCTYLVIPWCSKFWAMVFMYVFQGTIQGAVEPVGYTEILSTWKSNGRMILLGLNFVYCVGGILSPLATAPFLMEIGDSAVNASNGNSSDFYTLNQTENDMDLQTYHSNASFTSVKSSRQSNGSYLYIAFLITSCLCFVVTIIFSLTYSFCEKTATKKENEVENATGFEKLPCYYSMLLLMGSMFCFSTGTGDVFLLYLSTFCTKHFSWDTTKSSLMMSVAYLSSTLSTIFGVILVKFHGPLVLSGSFISIGFLSLVGFAASSTFYWQEGIWLCASLHSFASMNFTSLLFAWTNDYIAPVSGQISSFFVLSSMIGSSLNPLLVGHVMGEMGTLWFSYLFVMEYSVLIAAYITAIIITQCCKHQQVSEQKVSIGNNVPNTATAHVLDRPTLPALPVSILNMKYTGPSYNCYVLSPPSDIFSQPSSDSGLMMVGFSNHPASVIRP